MMMGRLFEALHAQLDSAAWRKSDARQQALSMVSDTL